MDYIIPFDQIGVSPPGPWENAAPSSGVEGSIPNADFFPAVQEEILNVQDEAGLTRNAADFTQLLRAIRSGRLTTFADTGTADAMLVTPRTAHTALGLGVPIQVLKGGAGNGTTTPTLSVNGLVRQIVKEDGSALGVGDLPGGSLFSVVSDGSKFRVIGLRKSDATAAAGTVSPALQTYISKFTPAGSTKLSAFSAGLVTTDLVATPAYTNVLLTGNFSGASYVTIFGSVGMRSTDTSGNLTAYTARLALFNVTDNTLNYGPYLGGGTTQTSSSGHTQLPFAVPSYAWPLDGSKTYKIGIACQKGPSTGPIQTYDPEIYAQHDGVNN